MIRKTVLSLTFACLLYTLSAQHTQVFTHQDKLFHDGKELYELKKWSASYRSFETFLKEADATKAGMIQEAAYLRACNAYEMRLDNAAKLLQNYLEDHPYSPYIDRVYMMMGMMAYDAKQFDLAVKHFRLVDDSQLLGAEKENFLFALGYAYLETENLSQAADIFNTLKLMHAAQLPAARYYAGYTAYRLGNHDAALTDLLEIESHPNFVEMAPYYVAQIYYAKKNYSEVEKRAENLLRKYPNNLNNAELYRMIGEKAYADGDYRKAVNNLKQYEAIFPQVLRNDMYYLGVSYLKTDQPDEAVKHLSQAATCSDELSESAYLELGNAYVALSQKTNARLAYEAALRTNFNTDVREEALFNYALTTYETNTAFGESVNAFEQFISEFPQSKKIDRAYDYLSTVYLTSKNYEAAYNSILKISNLTPSLRNAKQYLEYQLGTDLFAEGNYTKALELFTRSIQTAPNGKYLADSYFWRGETYYRNHDYARAAHDFNSFFNLSGVQNNANYKMAFYSQAYAMFSQQRYSEALNWFTRYLNAESDKGVSTYADALNRIGDAYFSLRNFTKAEEFYKQTISLNYNGDYAQFQSAYMSGLNKNYSLKISKLEELLSKYPNSEYGDDAMYEIGRSYLMLENNTKALETYKRLTERFPNSPLAPKAELESGLVYFNQKNYNQSIESLQKVITNYPGSEEANTAFESLESVYIETNRVTEYLEYARSIGKQLDTGTLSRADSIQYIAAEKLMMDGKNDQAIESLAAYIAKYCPGGKYCTLAQYYLADLYYTKDDRKNALLEYDKILNSRGNPYIEEAALKCAEISFDEKNYAASLEYFKRLEIVAQSSENKSIARLGILRTSYFMDNIEETVRIANEIIADPKSDVDVQAEARLNRAKAYVKQNKNSDAVKDLKAISPQSRTAVAAESQFLLSELLYKTNQLNEAERVVLDFAKQGSPHQYWLARSFIVLADVYTKKGDDFQAKQYLLSLQKNYTGNDDVAAMIEERLSDIEKRTGSRVIK